VLLVHHRTVPPTQHFPADLGNAQLPGRRLDDLVHQPFQTKGDGWRQEKLAQSAREISDLGKQVYERASVLWDHLDNLGKALTAAVNTFNKAVGSFETRLLPGIRRFRDLGATAAEPIPPLEVVESTPRLLGALPEAGKADGESENQG